MIVLVDGVLVTRELDRVEVLTDGGVGYELLIPLSVYEGLPRTGERVRLHTHLAVKEDGWQLFGFADAHERKVFQRLLAASGVGPALALGMLSTLSAVRVVQAIRERDIATLQGVPRRERMREAPATPRCSRTGCSTTTSPRRSSGRARPAGRACRSARCRSTSWTSSTR